MSGAIVIPRNFKLLEEVRLNLKHVCLFVALVDLS